MWLPWTDTDAHDWRLADALNGDVFDRRGLELAAHGLYVDLAPWRFHWLTVAPHA